MSVTRTQNFKELLRDGIAAVFTSDKAYKDEHSEIYSKHKAKRATEIEVEMKMFGPAQVQAEGAAIAQADNMSSAVTTYFTPKKVSLMFAITREAVEDNLYMGDVKSGVEALKYSMHQTKEILGASLLNNATNPLAPLGDGQPLLSTAHPLMSGGSYSNMLSVSADLAEASLEQLIITINSFRDQAGNRVAYIPRKLIVPTSQQFAAERLLKSNFQAMTNNNAVNAIKSMGMFPDGYAVNHYLVPQRAWYILTDCPGMKLYQRKELDTEIFTDPQTQNYLVCASERYVFGCSNPRAIAGSFAF